jgi:hypothetical protein
MGNKKQTLNPFEHGEVINYTLDDVSVMQVSEDPKAV